MENEICDDYFDFIGYRCAYACIYEVRSTYNINIEQSDLDIWECHFKTKSKFGEKVYYMEDVLNFFDPSKNNLNLIK